MKTIDIIAESLLGQTAKGRSDLISIVWFVFVYVYCLPSAFSFIIQFFIQKLKVVGHLLQVSKTRKADSLIEPAFLVILDTSSGVNNQELARL